MSTDIDTISGEFVDQQARFDALCQQWLSADVLALDTEFIRTDTFYPIVGLLQVNDGSGNYLIDPLAINDTSALAHVLTADSVLKVLHSCSEDLEVFDRWLGVLPAPLFDTQLAAAFCGLDFSMSYQRLVDALMGVHVPKGETRSNWLQRPLTASQMHYAALDVEFLLAVYQQLSAQLVELGRDAWLAEECAELLAKFKRQEPYYLKVKSAWKLQPKQLYLLDLLTQWREQTAREKDVPRGRVLKDRSCFEVAVNFPTTAKALATLEDIGPGTIRRYGDAILDWVAMANAAPASDYPQRLAKPLPKESGASLKTLKRIAAGCAQQLNIPVEVLVKKRDYEALLRSGLTSGQYRLPPALCGWREQVVGKALLESLRSQS